MALSSLDDKASMPDGESLAGVLGRSRKHWDALVAALRSAPGAWSEEWNYGGPKYGWSLRLKQGKRTILYLIPGHGRFLVGVVLGEKAVRAAEGADLPREVLELIRQAPKYAEGRGFRMEVRTRAGVEHATKLASIKVAS